MKQNDCSTPEYIVNCTVNVQDMCQKEVLVKPDVLHRQGELRVHLLLQHPPLQRAPEEAPHPLSGDVQSAFSLPHLPPAATPPCDVD
ncbi:hypothetical protein F7725_009360 [Dissostichus mawsoni]|uniref:Uncharacterized protein n=1 Tax=Dissostichus mawsoni TaxID=36200 RepID=A0A7J5Z8M7_DISMA|nr:hypothetical protein F7725_009360 [Dissostichus mawsoni]